jgi:hypothetical protein
VWHNLSGFLSHFSKKVVNVFVSMTLLSLHLWTVNNYTINLFLLRIMEIIGSKRFLQVYNNADFTNMLPTSTFHVLVKTLDWSHSVALWDSNLTRKAIVTIQYYHWFLQVQFSPKFCAFYDSLSTFLIEEAVIDVFCVVFQLPIFKSHTVILWLFKKDNMYLKVYTKRNCKNLQHLKWEKLAKVMISLTYAYGTWRNSISTFLVILGTWHYSWQLSVLLLSTLVKLQSRIEAHGNYFLLRKTSYDLMW